jgi:phage baseplate assembly protein V
MSAVPRSRSTDQRFYGVVEGVVEDNDDPDGEGRVKVRYPWFSGEMVSGWCRVAQLYAGPGFGSYFVPERDTEVVVAFIHGDMRKPIVVGGLYSVPDQPPFSRNGSDPKFIQTKAGHRILFEDTDGQRRIEVIDASGNNRIVIDTAANTITVRSEGDLSIEAATGSLTLKGATGVTISSDGAVNVSGTTINLN